MILRGLGMEFLHAINQSLFLFINADHDDHPGAIVIALLIAEYLTAITLAAVAVYLVWKHRRRRVVWLNVLCSLLLGMAATYLIRKGWHVPRPFDMQLLAALTVKYGLRPLWMRWLDSADGKFAIQDKKAT